VTDGLIDYGVDEWCFWFVDDTIYTCGESSAGAGVGINNEARMIFPALSKCIIKKYPNRRR
jgi:hypothetical protein